MNIYSILGWILLLSPFMALTVFMLKTGGWRMALTVWGMFFLVVLLIYAGTSFLQMGGVVKP